MPEHAMSTVKFSSAPSGLVIWTTGLPYSLIRVDGIPIELAMALETWELSVERKEPAANRISDGGGIRKNRNMTGKAKCRSA